jgi:hypothetical protein
VAGKKRRDGRELADLSAAYHCPPAAVLALRGETPSYLHYVQLVLNLPRVKLQPAVAVAQGLGAADAKLLDWCWADAAETDPQKAERTYWRWSLARTKSRRKK